VKNLLALRHANQLILRTPYFHHANLGLLLGPFSIIADTKPYPILTCTFFFGSVLNYKPYHTL
jgi:hypothetical protein